MPTALPLQFGLPGGPEVLIILLIAVLLFGANKIPKLARSTGEAMGEFQKGRQEVEEELKEMRDGTTESADVESESETPEVEAEAGEDESETDVEAEPDDDLEIADAESETATDEAAEAETERTD